METRGSSGVYSGRVERGPPRDLPPSTNCVAPRWWYGSGRVWFTPKKLYTQGSAHGEEDSN